MNFIWIATPLISIPLTIVAAIFISRLFRFMTRAVADDLGVYRGELVRSILAAPFLLAAFAVVCACIWLVGA